MPDLSAVLIPTLSVLCGTVAGGVISYFTNKNLNKSKWALEQREREVSRREQLYSDFMAEASRLVMREIEQLPFTAVEFSQFFTLLSRLRLTASKPVIEAAEYLAHRVTALSRKTSDQNNKSPDKAHLTETFIGAARIELSSLRRGENPL